MSHKTRIRIYKGAQLKRYALGFLFNADHSQVLLVHKLRPDWQRGLLNGLGGKVENNETPLACIVRETKEESSLRTAHRQWLHIGELASDAWLVSVFAGTFLGSVSEACKNDKEAIGWFSIDQLPDQVIQNLKWLIPLSLEYLDKNEVEPSLQFFSAVYDHAIKE
jgi:8-oxo-dGTP diphosphatase